MSLLHVKLKMLHECKYLYIHPTWLLSISVIHQEEQYAIFAGITFYNNSPNNIKKFDQYLEKKINFINLKHKTN